MATESSRIGPVLVALVVGAGVAFLTGCATQGATFTVVVGPAAKELSIPTVTLSKGKGEKVIWLAKDSTKTLFIEFELQPFQGMQLQTQTGRYRVACQGGRCDSGTISPRAEYNKDYKYWQILVDATTRTQDVADGHIIIKN